MKTLSIVIPVYFNEESLPILFERLHSFENALLEKKMLLNLICVDDGSRDNSFHVLTELKKTRPETQVIKLVRNFGAVHASKAGFQHVKGDCFIILAADLQDPPETILEMVDLWLKGHLFVIAKRQKRKDPFVTKLFASLYYFFLRRLVVSNYPSNGFDLFLMDKLFLPYMQISPKNINPNLYAYSMGIHPAIITYTRNKRLHGKSRWTFQKKLVFFLDSILGFSMIPMRLITLVGMTIATASFSYGLWILGYALFHSLPVAGFATLVTIITFLLSLVIMMLGIIGEYIWRIFDEVNRKPEYVIEEIL